MNFKLIKRIDKILEKLLGIILFMLVVFIIFRPLIIIKLEMINSIKTKNLLILAFILAGILLVKFYLLHIELDRLLYKAIKIMKNYMQRLIELKKYYVGIFCGLYLIVTLVNKSIDYLVIKEIVELPTHKMNIFDLLVTLLFVDFGVDLIKIYNNKQRMERLDWDLYLLAVNTFEKFEFIFDFNISDKYEEIKDKSKLDNDFVGNNKLSRWFWWKRIYTINSQIGFRFRTSNKKLFISNLSRSSFGTTLNHQ